MKTNNIQTSNSLSFGAKLQISRRTCVRGKKFMALSQQMVDF